MVQIWLQQIVYQFCCNKCTSFFHKFESVAINLLLDFIWWLEREKGLIIFEHIFLLTDQSVLGSSMKCHEAVL